MAELLRVIAVVALLGVAAAIATPRGRLPLALRGLQRVLGKPAKENGGEPVGMVRRLVACALVVAALALVVLW